MTLACSGCSTGTCNVKRSCHSASRLFVRALEWCEAPDASHTTHAGCADVPLLPSAGVRTAELGALPSSRSLPVLPAEAPESPHTWVRAAAQVTLELGATQWECGKDKGAERYANITTARVSGRHGTGEDGMADHLHNDLNHRVDSGLLRRREVCAPPQAALDDKFAQVGCGIDRWRYIGRRRCNHATRAYA